MTSTWAMVGFFFFTSFWTHSAGARWHTQNRSQAANIGSSARHLKILETARQAFQKQGQGSVNPHYFYFSNDRKMIRADLLARSSDPQALRRDVLRDFRTLDRGEFVSFHDHHPILNQIGDSMERIGHRLLTQAQPIPETGPEVLVEFSPQAKDSRLSPVISAFYAGLLSALDTPERITTPDGGEIFVLSPSIAKKALNKSFEQWVDIALIMKLKRSLHFSSRENFHQYIRMISGAYESQWTHDFAKAIAKRPLSPSQRARLAEFAQALVEDGEMATPCTAALVRQGLD